MKKSSLLLLFLCFAIACSEKNLNSEITTLQNDLKIEQILKNTSKEERKLAYSLLTEYEKSIFWKKKLNYALNSENLGHNQKNILNNILIQINENIFFNGTDENEIYKNITIPKNLKKLQKSFSNNEIGNLFYTLKYYIPKTKDDSIITQNIDGEEQGDGGTGDDAKSCDCNRNSMFSCTWLDSYSCKKKTCKEPEIPQCGFLGMYPCNGICKPYGF